VTVDTKVIEKVISIDAPPETVFSYLIDPARYVRWKGKLAQLDPRPGGEFRVEFASGTDIAAGRFVEVIRRAGSSSPGAGRGVSSSRPG
jgi:uncharacterized protein YndB with AHSA1/START domain